MKNLFLIFLFFATSSCFHIYKPINPQIFNYSEMEEKPSISYGYQVDVLTRTENKYYAKKGWKDGIDMLAVKIQNNTNEVIYIKKQIKFYSGNRLLTPLDGLTVVNTFTKENALVDINNDGSTAIPNAINESNKNSFINNFIAENLMNKRVQPGETIYGLVAFRGLGTGKLEIKLDEK